MCILETYDNRICISTTVIWPTIKCVKVLKGCAAA